MDLPIPSMYEEWRGFSDALTQALTDLSPWAERDLFPEPWKDLGPYLSGYTAGTPIPQFRKDVFGRVFFRGYVDFSTTAVIANLPVGIRPTQASGLEAFVLSTNTGGVWSSAYIDIDTAGAMTHRGGGTVNVCLSPVSYFVDYIA